MKLGFSYRSRKAGEVQIVHRGVVASSERAAVSQSRKRR